MDDESTQFNNMPVPIPKVLEEYHKWYYDSKIWTITTFRGVKALKYTADLWNYQEIICDLKPSLIVECGTAYGGSTLYFSTILKLVNPNSKVFSIDIDHTGVADIVRTDPHIELFTAKVTDKKTFERIKDLKAIFKGPIFVILDDDHSKCNVLAEMEMFRGILVAGDYLVVEDGNINGHPVAPGFGEGPMEAIMEYFRLHPYDYTYDIAREKKFGVSFAPKGFLIRNSLDDVGEKIAALTEDLTAKDGQLASLTESQKENVLKISAMTEDLTAKDGQLASLTEELQKSSINNQILEKELNNIKSSVTWQMVTKFHQRIIERCFSQGTKRRKLYDFGLRGTKLITNKGMKNFLATSQQYIHQNTTKQPEYSEWISLNEPSNEDLLVQKQLSQNFDYQPLISIIVPVYNTPPAILESTIRSVLEQTYSNWELCIVDGKSTNPNIEKILNKFSRGYPRIKIKYLERNLGISGNSNVAIAISTGEFVTFLDHDDTLAPFALFEVVKALNENQDLDFIYSDKDLLSENGKDRFNPLFKPDWSPDIMFSANYLTHLCVIRKSLVNQLGGFLSETDGAQDWDLFLRVTEKTNRIYHIPQVLYHWRLLDSSCSKRGADAKPYIMSTQRITLENHIKRCGLSAKVLFEESGIWRIKWDLDPLTTVSIIIPSKDLYLLKTCLNSIFEFTTYKNYEIIIIDMGIDASIDPDYYNKLSQTKSIQLIPCPDSSNFSKARNAGTHHAQGSLFLFLEENIKIISSDWIEEMGGWSMKDGTGVVCAKILSSNHKIYNAGVVLGLTGIAGNPFEGAYENTMGPFGYSEWYRDYITVSDACMMIKRQLFEEMGGFDERYSVYGNDLGLKLWENGYRNVYTPFARLELIKPLSNDPILSTQDLHLFYQRHKQLIDNGDPYFNKNLSNGSTIPKLKQKSDKTSTDIIKEALGNGFNI